MDLIQYAVYDEYYQGLKSNGWSREEASKAARRHVKHMTPRKLKAEVARILKNKIR